MASKQIQSFLRCCSIVCALGVLSSLSLNSVRSQEIKYEDRIGSNRDFDMCEDFRFKRITKLVKDGKISQQQGYNIWKRLQSDKEAVRKVLGKAVAAHELNQDQADRLLVLVDREMSYFDSKHGRFGQPKELGKGQFKPGEVTAKNRAAVYQRLIAANQRGEMYDYDVASIMKQLYAGFDSEKASVEEVAQYRGALNPRIAQSGSQARVLQNARMQQGRSRQKGYGAAEIKITDPAEWTKSLEKPIYSGPQPGEKVPSLKAVNMRGESAGKEFDPVELAGDKLHLMFFVRNSRTFGRFLGQLRQQLQSIEESSKQPWAMSVIVCTDDANEAEKNFSVLDQRYPKNLVVGLSTDGSAGPPAYGLDKNLTATVIVVKDGKVAFNFAHAGNAFYSQPHFLGAIAKVMDVDHGTLRKHIGSAPGDAAAAAYGRKRMTEAGGSTRGSAGAYRNRIAVLVKSERLTRAEAGELLRASVDETALQKKVAELLVAGKITEKEARELMDVNQE
ncbi:MAG: hypothetical protein VX768_15620 [Planctomycetota bacterium]|nr:hypothetical protein [Planctomycetota bacterium]